MYYLTVFKIKRLKTVRISFEWGIFDEVLPYKKNKFVLSNYIKYKNRFCFFIYCGCTFKVINHGYIYIHFSGGAN